MKTDAKPQPNARVSGCCGGSAPRTPRAADGDAVREMVRDGYARVALDEHPDADAKSRQIGYSDEQLEAVPEGANLGVGCGNPTAIDSLRAGEVVVDLGSGAGFDAFLAARAVGPGGRVIGVDMTDEMLEKARANAAAGGFDNVEFRKGYIEDLPVDDASVDVIISNCVINLSPDKPKVYAEAYRVLRPGGRVMVSDVVLDRPLPEAILGSVEAYVGCVGGAVLRDEYLATIRAAGFGRVEVTREASVESFFSLDDPSVRDAIAGLGITEEQARGYVDAVRSVHVLAVK